MLSAFASLYTCKGKICLIKFTKIKAEHGKNVKGKKLWIWNETEISSVVRVSKRDWDVGRLASSSIAVEAGCLAGCKASHSRTNIWEVYDFTPRLTQSTQGQSKSGDSWFD